MFSWVSSWLPSYLTNLTLTYEEKNDRARIVLQNEEKALLKALDLLNNTATDEESNNLKRAALHEAAEAMKLTRYTFVEASADDPLKLAVLNCSKNVQMREQITKLKEQYEEKNNPQEENPKKDG